MLADLSNKIFSGFLGLRENDELAFLKSFVGAKDIAERIPFGIAVDLVPQLAYVLKNSAVVFQIFNELWSKSPLLRGDRLCLRPRVAQSLLDRLLPADQKLC